MSLSTPKPQSSVSRRRGRLELKSKRHPPELIHVVQPPMPITNFSNSRHDENNEQELEEEHFPDNPGSYNGLSEPTATPGTGVRFVVSSTCSSADAPEPPREPPPTPSELLGLAIVGPSQSGKTILIQQFIHRRSYVCENSNSITSVSTRTLDEYSSQSSKKYSSKKSNSSKTKSSHNTMHPSMDYYKKDLSFWSDRTTAICVRLQVWDFHFGASAHTISTLFQQQLSRTKAIILVTSLEYGISQAVKEVKEYMSWLTTLMQRDHNNNANGNQCCRSNSCFCCCIKPVYWFLHKSDLLAPSDPHDTSLSSVTTSSSDYMNWIRIGGILEQTCRDVGCQDWFLTSCLDDASVETAMMKLIRKNLMTKKPLSSVGG